MSSSSSFPSISVTPASPRWQSMRPTPLSKSHSLVPNYNNITSSARKERRYENENEKQEEDGKGTNHKTDYLQLPNASSSPPSPHTHSSNTNPSTAPIPSSGPIPLLEPLTPYSPNLPIPELSSVPDTEAIKLSKKSDAEIRRHERYLSTLCTKRVLDAIAAANNPHTLRAPTIPVKLPSHMILAAERGIFPKSLKELMAKSGLGVVDIIHHTSLASQCVREKQLLRHMATESSRRSETRSRSKVGLPPKKYELSQRVQTSVREHPFFAQQQQNIEQHENELMEHKSNAPIASDLPSASISASSSFSPSSPSLFPSSSSSSPSRVDALLESTFLSKRFVHQFEDANMTESQYLSLKKCRVMEHYKRRTRRLLIEQRHIFNDRNEDGTMRTMLPLHPATRHRNDTSYRFNDEDSDESLDGDGNGDNTFLTGIVADEPPLDEFQLKIIRQSRKYDVTAPLKIKQPHQPSNKSQTPRKGTRSAASTPRLSTPKLSAKSRPSTQQSSIAPSSSSPSTTSHPPRPSTSAGETSSSVAPPIISPLTRRNMRIVSTNLSPPKKLQLHERVQSATPTSSPSVPYSHPPLSIPTAVTTSLPSNLADEIRKFHSYVSKKSRQESGYTYLLDDDDAKQIEDEIRRSVDQQIVQVRGGGGGSTSMNNSRRPSASTIVPPPDQTHPTNPLLLNAKPTLENLQEVMLPKSSQQQQQQQQQPSSHSPSSEGTSLTLRPSSTEGGQLVSHAPTSPSKSTSVFSIHSPYSVALSNWMTRHGKIKKTTVDSDQIHRCWAMFQLLDSNNDGTLEVAEMQKALAELGMHVDLHHLKLRMRDFDPDKDGKISFEQFLHGVSSIATWDTHIAELMREKQEFTHRQQRLKKEAAMWKEVKEREDYIAYMIEQRRQRESVELQLFERDQERRREDERRFVQKQETAKWKKSKTQTQTHTNGKDEIDDTRIEQQHNTTGVSQSIDEEEKSAQLHPQLSSHSLSSSSSVLSTTTGFGDHPIIASNSSASSSQPFASVILDSASSTLLRPPSRATTSNLSVLPYPLKDDSSQVQPSLTPLNISTTSLSGQASSSSITRSSSSSSAFIGVSSKKPSLFIDITNVNNASSDAPLPISTHPLAMSISGTPRIDEENASHNASTNVAVVSPSPSPPSDIDSISSPPSLLIPRPLPPVGIAAGLSLGDRQAIANLRHRSATRAAQAEEHFKSLHAQRISRHHHHQSDTKQLGFKKREDGKEATKTKPTVKKEKNNVVSAQSASSIDPLSSPALSNPAHSSTGAHNVPFFLWTAAYQRHSKLSSLIAAHHADQTADIRAQALELEQHKAELESQFAVGHRSLLHGLNHSTALSPAQFDSPRFHSRSINFAVGTMPLLNYDPNADEIRPATVTGDEKMFPPSTPNRTGATASPSTHGHTRSGSSSPHRHLTGHARVPSIHHRHTGVFHLPSSMNQEESPSHPPRGWADLLLPPHQSLARHKRTITSVTSNSPNASRPNTSHTGRKSRSPSPLPSHQSNISTSNKRSSAGQAIVLPSVPLSVTVSDEEVRQFVASLDSSEVTPISSPSSNEANSNSIKLTPTSSTSSTKSSFISSSSFPSSQSSSAVHSPALTSLPHPSTRAWKRMTLGPVTKVTDLTSTTPFTMNPLPSSPSASSASSISMSKDRDGSYSARNISSSHIVRHRQRRSSLTVPGVTLNDSTRPLTPHRSRTHTRQNSSAIPFTDNDLATLSMPPSNSAITSLPLSSSIGIIDPRGGLSNMFRTVMESEKDQLRTMTRESSTLESNIRTNSTVSEASGSTTPIHEHSNMEFYRANSQTNPIHSTSQLDHLNHDPYDSLSPSPDSSMLTNVEFESSFSSPPSSRQLTPAYSPLILQVEERPLVSELIQLD